MKETYHAVSFSGGKDSTAMLLHMLETGMPVDEIIFCDTGAEFPEMYEHIDKVEKFTGRNITRLKAEHSFEYYLTEHHRTKGKYTALAGYGWPGPRRRWCTQLLKKQQIDKYMSALDRPVLQYIGIAADETKRVKEQQYPLVDWGWTEADCLSYCYEKGFDWGGLYEVFSRLSCWCCPLQSLREARMLYEKFPKLWSKLKAWDDKSIANTGIKWKADYSVEVLEKRFLLERSYEKAGLPTTGKAFYQKIKSIKINGDFKCKCLKPPIFMGE